MGNFCGLFAQTCQPGARRPGLGFADNLPDVVNPAFAKLLWVKWQCTDKQLVEHYTQRVDIRAGINVLSGRLGLLRTHILRCANKLALLSVQCPLGQRLAEGLGHSEVDNLRHRFIAFNGHENIRRLDVTVNYSFLVGVLDSFTYLQEQLKAFFDAKFFLVAVLSEGQALNVLHYEVRPTRRCHSCIIDLSDIRVLQQGQGLAFSLEAGDDLFGIHAWFDDLQCHPAFDLPLLLRQVNCGETTFAKDAEQLIGTNLAG